jgi:tetratricopeptide (TPR) repeat protein
MLRTTSSDDDDTSYYQVPSPLRSHNEQDKQDERESMMSQNGSRRRRAKQSSGDNFYEKTTKSTTSKVFKVFFNTIVLLGVISFSAMFCLLIIAVVIENESSNQQGNKSPIDINLSLLKSHWERLKDRASLVYIASIKPLSSQDQQYNVSRRRRQGKISKVELGKTLLQNADPVGAETLCKAQINHGNLEHFEFVNALICLAEARLALHNAEWNMGVLESEHGLMYERLYLAKNNFDEAVSIEPTNLRARLGLGLVNYLIATREQPDSSSQLLFNSILHFEAVSVLASNTEQDNGIEWIPEEEKEQMRISATYNNGLAHLALGKVKASIPLLTKAYNLLDNDTKVGQGISSITTNLGAALLQRGAYEQAITVMNYSEVMKYCTDVQFQISDTDELSYVKQNYLNKQCSILLNNLSVAGEIEVEIGKTSYPTLAQATSNSEFSLSEWSILHEEKLGGQSFVKTDVLAKETKTQKLAVGEKESFVEVLLYEKENDPVYNDLADEGESSISINDLLSRSQTALEQNDINMAIDTIKKALDIAKEHNEVIACTKALQNALNTGISTGDENEASSVDTLRDEKILRLEHEILKLKIELLKESSIESSTNSNIESVKIRTIDIDSIDNEPSEDTQVTQDDDGRIQVVVDSNENKSVDSNVQKVDKSKAAPNQLQDPNDESIAEDNTDENVENVENVENANDFNETDLSESTITDELSKSSINEMSKEEETKSVKIRTIAIDSIDYNKSPEDTQDTQNDDSRIEVVDDSDENESVDNDVQIDDDLVVNEISENTPIEVISSDVTKQSNDVVDEKSSDNDEPQEVLSTETHDLVANEISENLSIEDINSITKQPSDAVDERSSDNDESQVLSSETHDSVGNEISENTPIEVISSDVTKQSNDVVDERSSDNDEPQVLSNESQSEEEVDLPELFTAPKIEAGPTE